MLATVFWFLWHFGVIRVEVLQKDTKQGVYCVFDRLFYQKLLGGSSVRAYYKNSSENSLTSYFNA